MQNTKNQAPKTEARWKEAEGNEVPKVILSFSGGGEEPSEREFETLDEASAFIGVEPSFLLEMIESPK